MGSTQKQRSKRRGQRKSNKISRAVVAQYRQTPAKSDRVEDPSKFEPQPRSTFWSGPDTTEMNRSKDRTR